MLFNELYAKMKLQPNVAPKSWKRNEDPGLSSFFAVYVQCVFLCLCSKIMRRTWPFCMLRATRIMRHVPRVLEVSAMRGQA